MKKKPISRILITIIIAVAPFIAFSQEPPPPPPPGHGSGGNVPGGGAPIGGGIGILLALGAVYGGKKVYVLCLKNRKPLKD